MRIQFTNRARKDLQKLPPTVQAQLREAIRALGQDPFRGIKLTGPWKGYRRLRSGDYRIIYRVYGRGRVVIYYIRHRREAYRRS